MLEEKEIVIKDLRAACAELNKAGLVDEPMKVVGIKKMTLVENFAKVVETLAENGLEESLPTKVKEVYNTIFADEFVGTETKEEETEETEVEETEEETEEAEEEETEEAEEEETEEAEEEETEEETEEAEVEETEEETEEAEEEEKEAPKKKKPAAKKAAPKKAAKKKEVVLSIFGHRLNTMASALDDAFAKGVTLEQAAVEAGTSVSRAKHHLNHLKTDKGLRVLEVKDGVFKVSE